MNIILASVQFHSEGPTQYSVIPFADPVIIG